MKIQFVFLLLGIIGFSCSEDIQTPLSVANPYTILAKELPRHNVKIQQSEHSLSTIFSSLFLSRLMNNQSNITDPCANSLYQFGKDLYHEENYAIQMFDAWGKLESGIKQGNLRWGGRYFECLDAQPRSFKPKYCTTYAGGTPDAQAFGLGIQPGVTLAGCYPDTCSVSNITSLFQPLVDKANVSTLYVTCPATDSEWMAKDVLALIILILLVCLVIASTTYEYLNSRTEKDTSSFMFTNSTLPPPYHHAVKDTTRHKVLCSFSIISNTKTLLSTEQRSTDISCLHGMRFISMCWVILGHSFLFPVNFSNNLLFMAQYFVKHWEFQAVGNATFSVDTFFFLSGLLVAYLGMRQLTRRDGAMNVPMMYLFRYLRLTPPYALLILLSVGLWPKMGSGPMWHTVAENQQNSCGKYWFSNLLYFNNLYPSTMANECYAWGWYLANDTQFYLLAPIFLYLLYKVPYVGLAVTSSVTLASMVVTGVFSSLTEQQPQALGIGLIAKATLAPTLAANGSALQEQAHYSTYLSDLYTKPWCRIGAYLVGMITGYLVHHHNNKLKMPKVLAWLGWTVFAATACAILYGLYPSFSNLNTPVVGLDNNTAAFYNAVSRPLWTVCLAWVTIACTNGYGGLVNMFLSWKVFMPLSRLTYCTYLVHPLVIWWLVATSETFFHYSIQLMIMIFTGTLILSSLLAYCVAMIIEFPVASLMKTWQSHGERPPVHERPAVNDSDVAPLVAEEDA